MHQIKLFASIFLSGTNLGKGEKAKDGDPHYILVQKASQAVSG